jgi:antitoxin (DNA-binding transcriptional repressor) of toxin-antitoxin stability system
MGRQILKKDFKGQDRGRRSMREIEIFEFRTNCVSCLEEVSKTKTALRVTRRGKPLVDVIPAPVEEERSWIGSMTGTLKITGDIVSPVILSD